MTRAELYDTIIVGEQFLLNNMILAQLTFRRKSKAVLAVWGTRRNEDGAVAGTAFNIKYAASSSNPIH